MLKHNNNIIIFINYLLLLLILIILLSYFILKKDEPFDFFTCSMTLNDINPKFKDEYTQYNNKSVSCGVCKRATLNVVVNTCPVDANGTPIPPCYQKATLTSSFGNPISFDTTVTPQNISNFFCF